MDRAESQANSSRTPFLALMVANAVSMVGNNLQAVAIPWFVLETTGSAARTGLVAFASVLPTVIAALLGGAIVDRAGQRRISIIADIVSTVMVGLIPLLLATSGLPFWLLLLLVAGSALLDAPGNTARMAMVPVLAGRGGVSLERANSAGQAIQSLSLLLGPVLAGGAIVLMGASNTLWFNAASFVVSAALIWMFVPAIEPEFLPERRYLDDVRDGLRFIRAESFLRATIIVGALANFAGAPLLAVLLPVFAKETYGEATDLGLLLAAVGGGSLLGALFFGARGGQFDRWPLLASLSCAAAAPIIVLMIQPPLVVAVFALVVAGFADGAMNPLIITAVQERVPPALLGRVMGTMLACILIAAPVGMVALGAVTERWGITASLGVGAAALVLVIAIVATNQAMRGLDAPFEDAKTAGG